MNTKPLIAALTLAVAGGFAVAQEATPDTWAQATAEKSFAQVRAELAQARKDGTTRAWSAGYIEKLPASKTREQVRAELVAARHSGEFQVLGSEAHGFAQPGARPATVLARTR